MRPDPWSQISAPVEARFTARRADANHPYNFFWARDLDGHCLLIFEYSDSVKISDRRPRMREIRVVEPRIKGEPGRFILELTHSENRSIFHRLCLDIIESTRQSSDEKSALATALRRTWRWHGMLKGGKEERLGPHAQKGLIGELRVLELALLPHFNASDAFDFWRGPEGTPKDFSIGPVAIEAKARRGAARPHVEITSEHQLDTDGIARLFLAVTCVDEAAPDNSAAVTLTDYVLRIGKIAAANDAGSLGCLEGRLLSAGYKNEHDYSDNSWVIGDTRWFEILEGFPRLAGPALPQGVRKVRYNLDLLACGNWETELAEVSRALSGDC